MNGFMCVCNECMKWMDGWMYQLYSWAIQNSRGNFCPEFVSAWNDNVWGREAVITLCTAEVTQHSSDIRI